jgi:CRP-like cAMP-binding protein
MFRQRLRDDPPLAEAWTRYLARQVQQARFRSEVLALRTVGDRLNMWMDWHDQQPPARGARTRLARELGVSREALYRELASRRR